MKHISVLLQESLDGLKIRGDGIYVDGTIGMGGHSEHIAKQLTTGRLIGIDQDSYALKQSEERLKPYSDRVTLLHGNFTDIASLVRRTGVDKVDGILLDIGVSSPQIDTAERGFSYIQDGPLDMRMDTTKEFSAIEIINQYDEKDLEEIFWKYGEERWGRRIAQRIVREREQRPIETTHDLVRVIEAAYPSRNQKDGHPAKRVFQALRIVVNEELDVLQHALEQSMDLLNPGGRLCVITFHSLEDRIVKQFMADQNRDCICPPQFPVCVCDHRRVARIITRKPMVASPQEMEANPRARSAKLRIAEKI